MVEVTIVVDTRAVVVEPHVRAKAKRLVKNPMQAANDGAAGVSPWPPSAVLAKSVARKAFIPAPPFMLPSARASIQLRNNKIATTAEVFASGDFCENSRMTQIGSTSHSHRSEVAPDPEKDILLGLESQPRRP